jgi:hypothetical protein
MQNLKTWEEKSRSWLIDLEESLKDSYEDEGNNFQFNPNVWKKCVLFVHALNALKCNSLLDEPNVSVGTCYELFLHWKQDQFDILLSFSTEEKVTYTMDDYKDDRMKGHSNPSKLVNMIDAWLSSFQNFKY